MFSEWTAQFLFAFACLLVNFILFFQFRYSMEEQDREDFGGTSQIEQSSVMYNVDDYDIIDYSENSDK